MQQVAETDGFRQIFFGLPSIGGRYSALSDFGIVPAAIQGLDVKKFLNGAQEMVRDCGADVAQDKNPGVLLGAILGTLQKNGRDKVTLFTSPGISDLGAWLEQLLAESYVGEQGKGFDSVQPRKSLRNRQRTARTAFLSTSAWQQRRTPNKTRVSTHWKRPASRSCASLCQTPMPSARSSSDGRWLRPSLGRS